MNQEQKKKWEEWFLSKTDFIRIGDPPFSLKDFLEAIELAHKEGAEEERHKCGRVVIINSEH